MPSEKQRISAAVAKLGEVGVIRLQVSQQQWEMFRETWKHQKEQNDKQLFNIDIWPWSPRRSAGAFSQNNAFNGYCRQIATATGNTFRTIKEYVMKRAFEDLGYPGETICGISVPQSDSDADRPEMTKLIWMAEYVAQEEDVHLVHG